LPKGLNAMRAVSPVALFALAGAAWSWTGGLPVTEHLEAGWTGGGLLLMFRIGARRHHGRQVVGGCGCGHGRMAGELPHANGAYRGGVKQ
jgi:hypothetical protein